MSNIYDKASLVLIPSGTKTSKVYSQKPVNGDGDFTFSRSTAATRVNADGNIEKETQNLLLQSNNFTSTWNVDTGITFTSGQSGYDGSSDAWKMDKTASQFLAIRQTPTYSGVVTFSVYAKEGTLRYLNFYHPNTTAQVWFDLQTGGFGTQGGSYIKNKIEDVGGGWHRCSVSMNASSGGDVRLYPSSSSAGYTAVAGNIYIQDAQIEQGLVARDYIETTTAAVEGGITDNVPRLDYTDSSCPALLLEPQRTNLLNNSEYLNDWSKTAVSVNSNVATSPEGVQNASEFVVTTQQNAEGIAKGFTADGTSDYVVSGYISKNSTAALVALKIRDFLGAGSTHCFVQFSPSTGVVQASIGEYAIESFNDDWWYVWSKPTTTIPSGARNAIIRIDNQSVGTNCIAYGIQVEAGSYATSYIPTYGTSVTRNADANITITSASSIIGQQEGTFYLEIDNALNTPNAFWYNVSDSSYTNWIFCGYDGNNFRFYVRTGNSVQYDSGAAGVIGTNKIVFIYKSGAIAAFVNGVQIKDATTTFNITASLNYITLGSPSPAGGAILEAYPVKQALLFPSALSNQEAIDLTTI